MNSLSNNFIKIFNQVDNQIDNQINNQVDNQVNIVNEENICPICHEDLSNLEKIKLTCGHIFCPCIVEYHKTINENKTSCPICKTTHNYKIIKKR